VKSPTTTKAKAPCRGLDSKLWPALGGDLSGLESDDQGRISVVLDVTGEPELPPTFETNVAVMSIIEGWATPASLCELAGTENVRRVRLPQKASPK